MKIPKEYKQYLKALVGPKDQEHLRFYPASRTSWFQRVVYAPKPTYYASRPPKRYIK